MAEEEETLGDTSLEIGVERSHELDQSVSQGVLRTVVRMHLLFVSVERKRLA